MDTYCQQQGSTRTGRSEFINWAFHSNYKEKMQWHFGWPAPKNLRAAELFGPLSPQQVLGGCVKEELAISMRPPTVSYTKRSWRLVSEAEARDGIANWSELSMQYAPRCMHSAFLGWGDAHDARNRWMGGGISVSAMEVWFDRCSMHAAINCSFIEAFNKDSSRQLPVRRSTTA